MILLYIYRFAFLTLAFYLKILDSLFNDKVIFKAKPILQIMLNSRSGQTVPHVTVVPEYGISVLIWRAKSQSLISEIVFL